MTHVSRKSAASSSVRAVIGAEVLVVDRDESVRAGIVTLAAEAKMNASCVGDPADAWELLRERFFSVAIVDLDTPHPNAGLETVISAQIVSPITSVIVLAPRKSYDSTVEVIRAGALDVIHKSPESVSYLKERMIAAAGRAQQRRAMVATLREASATHDKFLQLLMSAEREVVDLEDKLARREPMDFDGELRILVVDRSERLADSLRTRISAGYAIEHAQTGGEALDRASSTSYHFALVAHDLPDLPQSMIVRSLKSQSPELVALTVRGPCPGGSVELVDGGGGASVVSDFTRAEQLVERLPDLAEAFRAKERQRRYTQAFRERHYEFVQSFVSFKEKLDTIID